MVIVNPGGRVLQIDDANEIDRLLNIAGFRKALPAEIEEFERERAERHSLTPSSSDTGIYYRSVRENADGYGMGRGILQKELRSLGVLLNENFSGQKIGFLYNSPYTIRLLQTDVRLLFTMFESDKLPEDWMDYLKEANEIFVPSKWCQSIFAKFGVETTVVPLGYNEKAFSFIDRPVPVEVEKPFTFIHYNSFDYRKGFAEVFEAFTKEFKKNEPVRLILKTTQEQTLFPILKSEYPNIEVIKGALPENELVELLGRANCMVYPSRGEGFGITPLEAMATGMATIVPNAHGISEYFNADYMLEVKVAGPTPALYARYKGQDTGNMVMCDVKDLRQKMRYAYNHQAEMKALGLKASEYVKQWTYERTAKHLKEIFRYWQETEVTKRPESDLLMTEQI